MRIEPDSHVPVFLQIVEQLRSSIAAGVYRAGEGLPSLRVLSTDLRVNPNTVQRAFDELCRQGLIESRRGVGMFVAVRGVHSAMAQAEATAQAAFGQAVAGALAASLATHRIRELFDIALAATTKKTEVHS
jgi:GntR family transcriptional regulator